MVLVIVLSHLITKDGLLKNESKSRADKALKVVVKENAKYLITCGWDYRKDSNICLADAFNNYLKNKILKGCSIINQRFSRDTVGDAIFCKMVIDFLKIDLDNKSKIIVVSSDYHIERVKYIFSKVFGFKIEYVKTPIRNSNSFENDKILKREKRSLAKFKIDFHNAERGNVLNFFNILREKHSFYNGIIYPRISSYEDIKISLQKQISI